MENKLVVSKIVSNVYMNEYDNSEAYGYGVYNSHPLANIVNDELFLGSIKLDGYNPIDLEHKIPMYYCVRYADNKSFVCGLDLTEDGRVWVGLCENRGYFNTVEEALTLCEEYEGVKCIIVMEGEMRI